MAGVLADSSFGTTEHSASELTGWDRLAKGASFMVLDVSRFLPLDAFRAHVDQLIDDVHASERAPGVERILVPGELEAERRAERLAHGIPLDDALVAELDEIAASLDCPNLETTS
jgi:LDH2 family malate/lactate/ureidoglycolate dehydrogenase